MPAFLLFGGHVACIGSWANSRLSTMSNDIYFDDQRKYPIRQVPTVGPFSFRPPFQELAPLPVNSVLLRGYPRLIRESNRFLAKCS